MYKYLLVMTIISPLMACSVTTSEQTTQSVRTAPVSKTIQAADGLTIQTYELEEIQRKSLP